MPSDKIIAEFEKLLRAKRGVPFKSADRLGLEKPVLSQESDNTPLAAWEKAAALIGAALSPVSTIASMVLAPPAEETIFDGLVTGPDGKQTILPPMLESVVPKMRKQQRASIKPNPIVAAIQRHFQRGPTADPANDLLQQKINDRDFLVHATRPNSASAIRKSGGILPSGDYLPDKVLDDPVIRKMLTTGDASIFRGPFHSGIELETPAKTFKVHKNQKTGIPNTDPYISPGVSLSRQTTVPDLAEEKSYRFLLDPKARKTFSTSEPGFGKAGIAEQYKPRGLERHESEQRTYGMPYPVKPANKAITPDVPTLPTEERVLPENVDKYRATMGNETFKTILERLGTSTKSLADQKAEYKVLKDKADLLWQKLQESGLTPEYTKVAEEWMKAKALADSAFDKIYK